MPFDFGSMSDVKETDSGEAIATNQFDFTNMEDVPQETQAPSVISKFVRKSLKENAVIGPLEMYKTALYLAPKLPEYQAGDSPISYAGKVQGILEERESDIIGEGIGKVMETPMQALIVGGLVTAPVETVVGVGAFMLKDQFINFRRLVDENFPNTSPEVKDIAELADFAIFGGIIGKGITGGKKAFLSSLDALKIPRNVNIESEIMAGIKDSGNLAPSEKADMLKTLGIEQNHIDASLSGGVPINVPTSKIVELAEKPYWEIAKHELLGGIKNEDILHPLFGNFPVNHEKAFEIQPLLKNITELKKEKNLSTMTVGRLKEFIGIKKLKESKTPNLEKLKEFMEDLKQDDKFLSAEYDKSGKLIGGQLFGLKEIIKELPNPGVTPKRIVINKFGESKDILLKGLSKYVDPKLAPTVNIKEGHPLIEKVVDGVSEKMIAAEKAVSSRNEKLDKLVTKAEKSRNPLLTPDEKLKRKVYPQNKEIFEALSGKQVDLTKEEVAVVAYLKNFFEKAKKELALEKSRKNYVTHMEQPFIEKILNDGLISAIKDIFKNPKPNDLPVDIMLELDNIIGSEKFFKYALERKGGINPTTNIREIVNQYSHLYETKKALDQILPEGQAITKNLLQGKSAQWMKQYLQNLKGRGLDYNFRNGSMGWLSKVADGIVDLGYLKLLAFNWKSALKNVVAGETNAWIYQDFPTYLKGKERFYSHPKKAYELAKEYGALEGTYSDYAQKGIGQLKKAQDMAMIGQKSGEIEIRSSLFASMLSDKEWSSGKVEPKKFLEIKDMIAKTQGIFTKWDSPLLLQTWYGRMFMQMNRWRITNASLMHEITIDAVKDIRAGEYKTQNVSRFGKALVAYGTGMYISYQFYQAGYKTAGDITKNMAQTIDGIMSLFTEGQLNKIISENPTFQLFGELSNTIQNTAKYLHVPGSKKARGREIEDTYIAPIETGKDILEEISQ